MTPGTGHSPDAPEVAGAGHLTDPAEDTAVIHRLGTTGTEPGQLLVEYLELGLRLLSTQAGFVASLTESQLTVEAVAGVLPGELRLDPGAALPSDSRITGLLERRATVAWLAGRSAEPTEMALGTDTLIGTPVWIAGQVVGIVAFIGGAPPGGAFTPWQLSIVELLADGLSRLLVGAEVDARARSEATTRELLASIPDRLYRLDREGNVVSGPGGQRASSPVGGAEQALSRLDSLLLPAVTEAAGTAVGQTVETGEVQTRTFSVGDWGQLGRYEARFVRTGEGEVLCIVRDVTEQVGTEEALRENEERYRTVVEALAEGILIHDANGSVYACNRSATLILGVRETDLLGSDAGLTTLRWVLPDGSALPAGDLPARATLRTGRPTIDRVLGIDRDDEPRRWLRVNARPLEVSRDTRPHAVTSFADITSEMRAEQALAAQVEFEALVASISTRLIDCPADLVDQTVTSALGEVARFFGADVGFIDALGADRSTLRLTHEWRRPGLSASDAEADSVPVTNFDWTVRQFEHQPYIFVRSVDDLPEDAVAERSAFATAGNQAFLWVRLGGGVDLAGITGIVWKDRMPAPGEEQILSLVRLAGEAFLGALRRRSVGLLASGQARVFELIARGAPLTETLEAVARLLESRTVGTVGAVLVLADDGRVLTLAASPSLDVADQRLLDGLAVSSATPAAQAVRDVEVVSVPDVRLDPRFPAAQVAAERMAVRSLVAAPIASSRTGRVLGALLVQGREPHATDQLDMVLRESCSVLASVAIERAEDEARLAFQAKHDPLTGVSNRTALLDRLELALARCKRTGRSVAVLFCDLDRFKAVNDLHGHDTGDALLIEVARRIQRVLRPSDTVSRFGGDEFVVLCEDIDGPEQAMQLADRIAGSIELRPVLLDRTHVTVTASIGIAISTETLDNPEALLRDSDMAMYRAKARGRARRELFEQGASGDGPARVALAMEVARGIERDELRLDFQPIVGTDGRLRAVEALLRWQHPQRGLLQPAEFLPAAEEFGGAVAVGSWVIGEVAAQMARWMAVDPRFRALAVHVNLSARQLAERQFLEAFQASTESAGVNPASFVMEIAEHILDDDQPGPVAVLGELATLGVRVALDDFGTGYATLTSLRRFGLYALKIDRVLIDGLGREPETTVIVGAVVELAHTLQLEAIAEGVETPAQLAMLRDMGCDAVQGYLIGPPEPAADITERLRELLVRGWS